MGQVLVVVCGSLGECAWFFLASPRMSAVRPTCRLAPCGTHLCATVDDVVGRQQHQLLPLFVFACMRHDLWWVQLSFPFNGIPLLQ